MARQTFVWTALPKGVAKVLDERLSLELSVFVSVRLQRDPTDPPTLRLRDFPQLESWPDTVGGLAFLVTFDRGVPLPDANVANRLPTAVTRDGRDMRERWRALFRPGLRVDSYVFDDLSGEDWLSYPAGELARRIREGYVAATQEENGGGVDLIALVAGLERRLFETVALPELPIVDRPLGPIPAPTITGDLLGGLLGGVLGSIGGTLPIPKVKLPRVRNPLSDFMGFHLPPVRTAPPERLSEDELRQHYDFHQLVSALSDHPELLRKLGLVVDLSVVVPLDLAERLLPMTTVQVRPVRTPDVDVPGKLPVRTLDVSPATTILLDGDLFLTAPRPQDPESERGLLRLSDERYQVEQFDIDGAMFKIQGEVRSVRSLSATLSPTMPPDVGLPALRTTGISVVRDDRDAQLAQKQKEAAARNARVVAAERAGLVSADAGDLFAEDVTAGYRVDVWDDVSRTWHSLHDRLTDFVFPRPARSLPKLRNEGFLQTVVTRHPPGEDGSPANGPIGDPVLVSPAFVCWEGWSLSAPRVGKHISPDEQSFVDRDTRSINGLDVQASSVVAPGTLPRLRIGRTYHFRARLMDLAGTSRDPEEAELDVPPEQLPQCTKAIRFGRFEPVSTPVVVLDHPPEPGESVEWIVARSDPVERAATLPSALAERDLVPPKVAQQLAEAHGCFDDPATKKLRSGDFRLIVARDKGTFQRVGAGAEHVKVVRDQGRLRLPYLPDPMARGVLLVGLPGAPLADMPAGPRAALTHVPFRGPWPDPLAVHLRLVGIEFDSAPALPSLLSPAGGGDPVLTVEIPEAHIVTVRMSSCLSQDPDRASPPTEEQLHELGKMGIWQWIDALAPEDQKPRLRKEAVLGRNWLLMPHRDITLVHAVQRPVLPPAHVGGSLAIERRAADTSATIGVTTRVHGFSTAKVELRAAWTDPIDDGRSPTGKELVPHLAVLADRPVRRSDAQVVFAGVGHHFGDTKYHRVTYSAVATSSFREYFHPNDPPGGNNPPRDFTRASQALDDLTEDVLSSARPPAPGVVSAVPAFNWRRETKERVRAGVPVQVVESTRRARTVRVYLERPWYASGDRERLGVVFVPDGELADDDPRRRFVTRWGTDPAWSSPANPPITEALFRTPEGKPAEVHVKLGLSELPAGPRVSVAAYEVAFDAQRQLWFADVTLHTDSYFPFVRLAVARFQVNSLPGLELSPVVVTDFVQLPPDRALTDQSVPDAKAKVRTHSFRLSGVVGRRSGTDSPPSPLPVRSEVRARVVVEQDDGQWVPEPAPVAMTFKGNGARGTWSGKVDVPVDGRRRRLVVEELEDFSTP